MRLGISKFFQDVVNFLWTGSVLGVDIGTVSVKLAELSRKGDRFRLMNYGILETKKYLKTPNQAIQTSSLKIDENVAVDILRLALSQVKPRTKTAIAAIPAFVAFTTPLDMPRLSDKETNEAVMFQARQYIPIPIQEISIDWMRIEEFENEQGISMQRVLLTGVPNEIIQKYRKIFRTAGLHLGALEVEGLALARSLRTLRGPSILLDIGAESTNITILENGVVRHGSQFDRGGLYVTQALGKSLGISTMRAEELKCRRGLQGAGGEAELSTLIGPFLNVILQEVRYALTFYERRYAKKVVNVVLLGGGALMLGIDKYVGTQLGLPVVSPPTFHDVQYDASLQPTISGLASELAGAVGLAKKYYS